jgi:hypothetical protein
MTDMHQPEPKRRPLAAPSTIRRWARQNGVPAGERGRLPKTTEDRYYTAQAETRRTR